MYYAHKIDLLTSGNDHLLYNESTRQLIYIIQSKRSDMKFINQLVRYLY